MSTSDRAARAGAVLEQLELAYLFTPSGDAEPMSRSDAIAIILAALDAEAAQAEQERDSINRDMREVYNQLGKATGVETFTLTAFVDHITQLRTLLTRAGEALKAIDSPCNSTPDHLVRLRERMAVLADIAALEPKP